MFGLVCAEAVFNPTMAMITPRVFNGEGFIFTLWVFKGGSNSGDGTCNRSLSVTACITKFAGCFKRRKQSSETGSP
jgi:hypothetical protein